MCSLAAAFDSVDVQSWLKDTGRLVVKSKVQSRGGPLRQAAAMHCGTRRLWLSADGLTNAACVAACKGTRVEQSEEFE